MRYDISITDNIACVAIEGNLNSLDLMFMLQSKEYKDVITHFAKIIIDYTDISGLTLTPQDVAAIAMLGKMDLENLGEITIVMAVNENERNMIEKVTKNIFADSHTNILITDSKNNAMKLLN